MHSKTLRTAGLVLTAGLLSGAAGRAQSNGVPVSGYPLWQERVMLVASNACRTGPQQFRAAYLSGYPNILQAGTSVPTYPLYLNIPLVQSSREHSEEMATMNYFAHNSFDGTSPFTRIQVYYHEGIALGENIAAGYPTPFSAIVALILDGGALDGTGGAGHRTNIMSTLFREMGTGYGYGASSTYHQYYTEDFGGGAADYASPLAAGTHMFTGDGNTTFMASYRSSGGVPVQTAEVVIDGVSHAMSLDFGVATQGTYRSILPTAGACRTYYFKFKDTNAAVWLYPETGQLRSFGEGGCAEDYVSTPVAVALGEISAHEAAGRVTVDWSAFMDAGAHFQVLRATADGGSYEPVSAEFDGASGRADFTWTDETTQPATDYSYKIAYREQETWSYSRPVRVRTAAARLFLRATASNPASGKARLEYQVPLAGLARLDIVNVDGRLVRNLFSGNATTTATTATWDGLTLGGNRAPAGIYFARLRWSSTGASARILLLD